MLAALLLGSLAGAFAGDSMLLHSNVVFRLVVGGLTTAVAYGVAAMLWFAWHRLTLDRVGLAGASAQAPLQQAEVSARDQKVGESLERILDIVEDLDARLRRLEGPSVRLDGDDPPD